MVYLDLHSECVACFVLVSYFVYCTITQACNKELFTMGLRSRQSLQQNCNSFLGLKIAIICFPSFLSSEWRTMASVLKEVVLHGAGNEQNQFFCTPYKVLNLILCFDITIICKNVFQEIRLVK